MTVWICQSDNEGLIGYGRAQPQVLSGIGVGAHHSLKKIPL